MSDKDLELQDPNKDNRKSTTVKKEPDPLKPQFSTEDITTDTNVGLIDMAADAFESARRLTGKQIEVPVPDGVQREQLDKETEKNWKKHRYIHPRSLISKDF
jgi:hypothetical protein